MHRLVGKLEQTPWVWNSRISEMQFDAQYKRTITFRNRTVCSYKEPGSGRIYLRQMKRQFV